MNSTEISKLNIDHYPAEERTLLGKHDQLFEAWKQELANCDDAQIRESAQWMTYDGFYPYYTKQKKKILFLGRDSYGMLGCNYLETFYEVYRHGKKIGEKDSQKNLNQHHFHARMLHVAWGILNKKPEWDMIPWAEEIGDTFGTKDGISFAFINLGKTRIEEAGTHADIKSIEAFCHASTKNRNFIAEQISMLQPNMIISMNMKPWLNWLGSYDLLEETPNSEVFNLNVNGHECLLINTWHFSARKEQKMKIYAPIRNALLKWSTK